MGHRRNQYPVGFAFGPFFCVQFILQNLGEVQKVGYVGGARPQ